MLHYIAYIGVKPVLEALPDEIKSKLANLKEPDCIYGGKPFEVLAQALWKIAYYHEKTKPHHDEAWMEFTKCTGLTDEDILVIENQFRQAGWTEEARAFPSNETSKRVS